jgi:hypothetical protein
VARQIAIVSHQDRPGRLSLPSLARVFAGSAERRGPFHVTMDSNDAIETAHAFPNATIVAVHNGSRDAAGGARRAVRHGMRALRRSLMTIR